MHTETQFLELARLNTLNTLLPFTQCKTLNWMNYCTKTSRFCPNILLPAVNLTKAHGEHCAGIEPRLITVCKISQTLPALEVQPYQSKGPIPHGNLCGEMHLFFPHFLALKGSQTLQWWWGDTESHFKDCSCHLFPGWFWDRDGRAHWWHWGHSREGIREKAVTEEPRCPEGQGESTTTPASHPSLRMRVHTCHWLRE